MNNERNIAMAEIESSMIARAVLRAFKKSWNDPAERPIIEARMERDRIAKQNRKEEETCSM
jgi:hypothetical protein